jgi:hypothetical protein
VVLVVAHALRDEVRGVGSHQGHGHGAIDELAIDLRPERVGSPRVGDLEALRPGDPTVDGRVAEPARVLPGAEPTAAEVLRDQVRGRRYPAFQPPEMTWARFRGSEAILKNASSGTIRRDAL